ncbi:MAG: prevent-host-death protein [Candidatus Gallionella acididurans]|uniref:Prevent-host-death protein n=1 Tax=Candidatus Gallionella acididurans TaxID=1796491 RepID=A0A139BSC1_9PROT|nr:MAG: prevent-host-death protein [Candidatus Gallionella acididurans]
MDSNQISKSEFKTKALEYFRQIEASGESIIVTDHGKPALEVRPFRGHSRHPLDVLRGSVVRYDNPMEPVAVNDWDAAQ